MPRGALVALLVLTYPTLAAAQSPTGSDAPQVGSVFPADVIRDLPVGDSVYAILETTQSELISDRFNSAGMNIGGDTRVGGFLGSWSQTLFRVGDIDISDPGGSGSALLFPDSSLWQGVTVTTGLMRADTNTPGLAVTLQPRRAGSAWGGMLTGTGSGGSLAVKALTTQPPPVARMENALLGSAFVSGPLSDRASLVAAGSVERGASYRREQLASTENTLVSGLAHLVFTSAAGREWRVLGWAQRTEMPFEQWQLFRDPNAASTTSAVHLQTTYASTAADPAQWRVFGGFTQRSRTNTIGPSTLYIDRIVDGPIPNLVETVADSTARRVSAGARLAPTRAADSAHRFEFGVNADVAMTTQANTFAGTVRESVDSLLARVWSYNTIDSDPSRTSTTLSAFAGDLFTLSPRLSLDAAVRAEMVRGSADGAATAVSWLSLLPHAYLRLAFSDRRSLTLGWARSANALTHNWLAFGDPGAPTARVVTTGAPNTVVARVGPGINDNVGFSGIDPDLKRPYTDEFVIGWEKRRSPQTRYTLTGIARREGNLLGVRNSVGASGYTTLGFPDAGKDLINPSDDRTLLVYNRLPSSFAQDSYLVTNTGQAAAEVYGLRMSIEHNSDRLFLLFGATASAALGSGGNRGYGPLENDQDTPGELFTTPNGNSYARGRLFADRAFTIKWTTLYRLPADITIAGIARYQDGQPFSRMVVVPNLNQGVEAVQSYPNGGSRYTFTGTFDFRLQKGVKIGAARMDAIFDGYNLFTRNNEVEEYVVSGPLFRTPTFIQPPRSLHVGLRLTF